MPTFNERLKAQNKRLSEKQNQLAKLSESAEKTREKIRNVNREIGEIKEEISALETRILTETIAHKGISVSELAAAIEAGAIIPEKPPNSPEKSDNEKRAICSTNFSGTSSDKEDLYAVGDSGEIIGGS